MLKALRKHARYFYVLFFIIILSFIFWGIGTVDNTEREIIAEVGKFKITADEYWRTYDRVFRFYRDIYKDKFDEEMQEKMNLKEKVLNSMINERVLLIAAKEAGMSINDKELQESITQEPAFMKDGVFDREVYLNRIKLNRMTPELYESSKRQELLIDKMRHFIALSTDVTDMSSQIPQTLGDEKIDQTITESLAREAKEKAVRSYVEGYKKLIKIKINRELIS